MGALLDIFTVFFTIVSMTSFETKYFLTFGLQFQVVVLDDGGYAAVAGDLDDGAPGQSRPPHVHDGGRPGGINLAYLNF